MIPLLFRAHPSLLLLPNHPTLLFVKSEMSFPLAAVSDYLTIETSSSKRTNGPEDLFSQLAIEDANEIVEEEEGNLLAKITNAVNETSEDALNKRTLGEYKRFGNFELSLKFIEDRLMKS